MTKAKKRGLYALLIAMLASAAAAGAIMLMPVSAHTAGAETTSVATQAEGDVAQIGENTYATLQAAADSIADETPTTIKLIADVTPETYETALSVNAARNIIIDLNGHNITTTNANEVFLFGAGASGSLTIIGNGNVAATGSAAANSGNIVDTSSADEPIAINIQGGTYSTVYDNSHVFYGTVDIWTSEKSIASINISGGTFTKGYLTSINSAETTISGGTFNGRVGLYNDVTITGGTFDPSDDKITYSTAATTNIEISGGSFTCDVPDTLIPEGTVFYEKNGVTAVGEEYIASAGAAAYVGSTAYATFNDAVAEATSGNTITLVADQTITTAIGIVEKNLVIDFNGFTLTGNVTSAEDGSPEVIGISNCSSVELKNGKIVVESEDTDAIFAGSSNVTLENITIEALATNNYGITFYGNMAAADALAAFNGREESTQATRSGDLSGFKTLTVKNSTISASAFAISGNARGDADGTIINIENSKIYDNGNSSGWGIFHPQIGIVNISGEDTEIKAATAIEMRGGELNITGGKIIATDYYSNPNTGSGPTLGGVAIAVTQHTGIGDNQRPVIVNVSGGTVEALDETGKAIYETDFADDDPTGIEINITGGNYSGAVYSENVKGFVKAGAFDTDLDDSYIAADTVFYEQDGKTGVGEEYVASAGAVAYVGNKAYGTLQAAIDEATSGAEITLVADVTENIVIDSGDKITLNLNGKTITNAGGHTIEVKAGGELTVNGTGTVTNVTKGKATILNNGTATLNGGTYNRSTGIEYYVIDNNKGNMTINSGVTVECSNPGSSLIRNGGDNNATTATPTLTITGGTFSGGMNTIKNDDYGILNISDGTFTNSTQHVILNWSTANITGGEFTPDSAAYGAVWTGTWYTSAAFEQGVTNITGGTFNGAVTTGTGVGGPVTTPKADYTISGGTFNGSVVSSEDNKQFITGGTFKYMPNEEYLAENMLLYPADGNYSVGTQEDATTAGAKATIGQIAYTDLADAVANVEEGETITLIADDLTARGVIVPSGSNFTIDFNGHTYVVTRNPAGSTGTQTQAFQLLRDSNLTFKNGTIRGGMSDIKMVIQNYSNLTLENMTLDAAGSTNATCEALSVNHGDVVVKGNTQLLAKDGQYAFDVYYWPSGGYGDGASVTFDNSFTGKVEGVVLYSGETGLNDNISIDIGGNGTFDITLTAPTGADIEITGGKFEEKVDPAYLAEGLVFYEKDGIMNVGERNSVVDGKNYVVSFNGEAYATIDEAVEDGMVARIGTYGYASLAEALAAAEAEDVVVLQTDTTIGTLILSDSFTLDLNGNTITSNILFVNGNPNSVITANISNGAINATTYGILVYNNVELNVSNVDIYGGDTGIYVPVTVNDITATKSTAVNIEGGSVRGGSAGSVLCGIGDSDATATSLVATDTLFAGGTFGITGNGTAHNTYIELNNCTVVGGDATPEDGITGDGVGIYHPQAGELVVNGGSVTGVSSGIEVRAGTVTINDADITATATEFSAVNNGNGTTITGAAIAVSQHTTNLPINVTVNGGTISGVQAVYEVDLENDEATDLIVVTLNDGVYNGGVYSENCTQFVSGGQYQDELNETYFAPGFDMQLNNDGMYEVVSVAKNLEAQADVRNFAATLGISWSQLEADAAAEDPDGLAKAAIEAYNAIYSAVGAEAISVARLDAMDAVAAYVDQSNSELATAKKTAVADIRQYAAASTGSSSEDNKVAVAVPTYIISAIYNATSEDEIDEYVTLGKAEIDEIRSERAKAEEQFEEFNKQFEAIKEALGITGDSTSGYTSEVLTKLDGIISALKISESDGTWGTTLLDGITADIATANTNIKAIQDLLGSMADEDTATTIIGLIKETQSKVADAETNIKTAIGTLSDKVVEEYNALNTAISKLPTNDAVTALTDTVNQLKTDIGTMNTTVGNLNTSIGELKTSVDTVAKAQETLETAVKEYKDAVDKTLSDISDKFTELSAKVDELPTNSELETALKSALDTALTDIKTTLDEIIKDTAEIDGLATEIIDGVDEKIQAAFATFKSEFETAVSGINDNIDAVQSVVDALPDDADMEALKSELEAAIKAATDAATAAGDKVDALDTTLDGRLDTVDTALGDIEGAIDDLTAAQKELSGMVESYKTAVNSALTEINGKFDTLTELIEAIPTDDELSAALNSALSTNLAGIIADIEQIKADTALIKDLDTTIVTKVSEKIDAAFAGFKTTFDEAIGTINGDLEAINNALALLPQGTDLAALKDEIAKATEAATAANTKIDELAGSLDSRLDSVNSSIASLRSTISSISAAQVALQATVNSYKTQLTEAVTTLTAAIEGVKADVNALSEAATADKLELLEKLTSLQTSADELEQAIAGLESGSGADLTAVVNQLNSLQTSLSDVSGVIDDISAGVDGTSSGLVGIYVCLGVIIALAAAILVVLIVKKRN